MKMIFAKDFVELAAMRACKRRDFHFYLFTGRNGSIGRLVALTEGIGNARQKFPGRVRAAFLQIFSCAECQLPLSVHPSIYQITFSRLFLSKDYTLLDTLPACRHFLQPE